MRVPLTGSYNTRQGSVNALTSSSGIVGIGIVGTMVVGEAQRSSDKDVRFINCLPVTVKDEITRTQRAYVIKRPGFVSNGTVSAGNVGTAVHVWIGNSNKVVSAFGSTNSTIYDGTSSVGAITGVCNGITETNLSGTSTLGITSEDSTAWVYPAGGVLAKITDGDFPGNAGKTTAGTFAYLDGYAFIMTADGLLYNSDLNSLTAWTASNYLSTNAYPDGGVGCIRFRDSIIAFGKESMEFYRNAGNASGSPLTRIDELTQLVGCISGDAIGQIRDTVYWAGATKQSNIAVYAYNGQLTKVSTPEIEAQLTLAGPSNVSITTMGFYGRHFVVVLASNTTYVYCLEENNWHEWNSTVPLWYKADGLSSGGTIVNYCVSDKSTSGKVFVFNPASVSYQDNGSAFSAIIQTAKLDLGSTKRKSLNRLYVVGDEETSTSTLTITYSDDDYQTSSTSRTVDLSDSRPNLTRLGTFRRRSFTLTHSANTPMRLEALDFDITEGRT